MKSSYSKLTSQGQISVPAEVRRKLGLRPGSKIRWEERGDQFVVDRASRYSSSDIHRALFRKSPQAHSLEEIDRGIVDHVHRKHAGR
jgi:antitoxin PrlF